MDNLTSQQYRALILRKLNDGKVHNVNNLGIDGLSKDLGYNICIELAKEKLIKLNESTVLIEVGGKHELDRVGAMDNLTHHLRKFVLDTLPKNTPNTVDEKPHIATIRKGIFSVKIFSKEVINYFWLPLFVTLIGTIILKIFGVL